MTQNVILDVKGLTLSVGKGPSERKLVNDVSFTVRSDSILGLIGESGSGKSLTCLAIMGLLPVSVRITGGTIVYRGTSLEPHTVRPLRGKNMAMILQNPMSCFDAVFTIRRHFSETLKAHGIKGKETVSRMMEEALAKVGFDNPNAILDLYPFQMSGGMLQRAMIAITLMMQADLLIADEPTTDLDVKSQARILNLLESLRRDFGMSILLVTHDLGVIRMLSDHVCVMKNGHRVENTDVSTLFRCPSHVYTRSLLHAHNSLYGPRLERFMDC